MCPKVAQLVAVYETAKIVYGQRAGNASGLLQVGLPALDNPLSRSRIGAESSMAADDTINPLGGRIMMT